MSTTKLRPLSFGEILDAAIKIYRRNVSLLIKLALPVLIPAALVDFIVQTSSLPDGAQIIDGKLAVPGSDSGTFIAGSLIATIVMWIATLIATGALYRAVAQTYIGAEADWRESLRFGAKRFHRLLWLSLIYAVIVTLGFIALIVPGVWMMVAFSCATPVLMAEGIGGWAALKRSAFLVKGRWLVVLGVLIVSGLLAAIVAGVIVGIILGFVHVTSPVGYVALDTGLTALITVITTPFTVAAATVMYFDLRVRKEGFDIELLAREAGIDAGSVNTDKAVGATDIDPWSAPPGVGDIADAEGRPE